MSRPTALIADDDHAIARLIAHIADRAGLDTTVVHDGADALQALEGTPFDLIVLDLMMPRVDGYSVIERLRDFKRRPAVVILSAMPTKPELDSQIVTCIVPKPFDAEMLESLLGELGNATVSRRSTETSVDTPA